MGKNIRWTLFLICIFSLILSSCSNTDTNNSSSGSVNMWTWVSGSSTGNATGNYGTLGATVTSNVPGARYGAVSKFYVNNIWLFGGYGYDSTLSDGTGCLNDLWKFDGTNWTWVSGSSALNQAGTYVAIGEAGTPGSRYGSVSWIDNNGNLWLFGGYGYDSAGNYGYLNDLWEFNGTNWIWVSGSSTRNQVGTYVAIGEAGTPGSRYDSVSWIDSNDNLWLFGGYGYDSAGNYGYLNDLWEFNGTNWTWVSGSSTRNQVGTYVAIGEAGTPGSRYGSVSWIDSNGNMWLFGGNGYDSTLSDGTGYLNDLWKFNGTNWTWVSGSSTMNQIGTYVAIGEAGTPGSRYGSVSWIDSSGNMWLFGGNGYDSTLSDGPGYLNDFWKFDGTNWTWVSGSSTGNAIGNYGTLDTTATSNAPGAREYAVSVFDGSNLWLFGGYGYDSTTSGYLNDLWVYQP